MTLMMPLKKRVTSPTLHFTVARREEEACRSPWINKDHLDNNVLPHCGGGFSATQIDDDDDDDDVYESLWQNNLDLARETFFADFVRLMECGSLEAERFVKFTLQDILYLDGVTAMLKEMSEKVTQPAEMKDFIKGRHSSYKAFRDSCLQNLLMKDLNSIQPTKAIQKYLDTYRGVMKESDPVYFVVALLPCSRLWVWLAQNLKTPEHSAYYRWKLDNMDGHPEKFRSILNKYLDTDDKKLEAHQIFRAQMQNEHDFFYSS
ncbi:hypothetical protein MHYP_G00018720 [Metynnis hypsauchen]